MTVFFATLFLGFASFALAVAVLLLRPEAPPSKEEVRS